MRKIKLKELASYNKGQQINGNMLLNEGKYEYLNGGINPSGKWNEYNVEGNTIAISEGGNSCGYVNYMNRNFWCGAHCYYLFNIKCNVKYLFYNLKYNERRLQNIRSGACMPNIKKKELGEFEIFIDEDIKSQNKIASYLDRISYIMQNRKKQIEELDELIKSQFVEMFENNEYIEKKKIINICKSIVRGPFGSALKKEFFVPKGENTYKVYEQKNAINEDSLLGTYYIDENKFNELKRFECKPGDIIMSCSGTIGKIYQLPNDIEKGVINQALLKFTLDYSKVLPIYFLEFIKSNIQNLETKGTGLQNLGSVSYIKEMEIPVPTMEQQKQFVELVEQIDKQKFEIQKSLEEMQLLQESLMNSYFGEM